MAGEAWTLSGTKRRAAVFILYPDEACASTLAGEACLRLMLEIDRDVFGRFEGVSVGDPDESTVVQQVTIDGLPVWALPQKGPAEGEVLEPPKPFYVHPGSRVRLWISGAFSRVLVLVQKAEPVKVTQQERSAG